MATQQEVLKTFMAALDATTLKGTAALDAALQSCTNFSSLQDFINKIVSDCKSVNDSEKFLRDYCGIIIGNADTGAISGSDAEGGTVKSATSIVPESGDLINFTGNEFTVDGLTVKLASGGGTGIVQSRNFSKLSTQEKYIWQSLYTYWIKGALDLLGESYGENFSFTEKSSATSKNIYVIFDNSNNNVLASTWGGPDYAQKCTDDMELHINLNFYNSATGKDGIPSSNQNYLDRIIAHEMTHAVMRSNIDYYDHLPKWFKEGMAELTQGVDDKRTSDLRLLGGNSSYLQRLLSGLSVSSKVKTPSYSGGYLALRYLAKQTADTYVKNFSGTDSDDQLETRNDSVTLSGGEGSDSLSNGYYTSTSYSINGGDNVSLSGGAGNDSLLNCAGNFVTLDGGKGNDTIINRDGSNAIISYTVGDGNDSVVGFNETSTLSITGGLYSTQKSGSDLIVTVGDGKITLKSATGLKTLNIVSKYANAATYDNDSAAKVTVASDIEFIDATTRTKAITITANRIANTILGGKGNDVIWAGAGDDSLVGNAGNDKLYGGADDDTLHGGTGNDILTGGAGADLFIYSAGKDVIADYATGDKISLGAAISSASLDGSDSVFKIGSGSLTVKDSKALTLIDFNGKEFNTILGGAIYDDTSDKSVAVASGIEYVDATARTKSITITANKMNNSILGGSAQDIIWAGAGDDSLVGNAGNDKLYGGADDDTLHGGTGNDILTGGAGNDLFIYSAGNDVIADYATGDKISLGAEVSSASLDGSDSVFKIGSGSLTVKNSKALTLIDFNGKEFNTILGGTIYDDTSDKSVAVASGVEYVDATARTKSITITANKMNNSILGGSAQDIIWAGAGDDSVLGNAGNDKLYGGADDDTLWGGTGNDILTGGAGADTFIYTAGNDVIMDFSDDDLLQISDDWTTDYNAAANSIAFNVGSTANAITLKNFTATTFKINGDAYRINGKQLVK